MVEEKQKTSSPPGKRESIRRKILLVVIPLTVFPLLILTVFVLSLSGRSMKNQVEQANEDIARESSGEIKIYVEGTADILLSLSEILGKANLSNIQKEYAISKVAVNTGKFNHITLTDTGGMEVLSSDPERELTDIGESRLFKEGKKDLYISPDITIHPYTLLPEMNISVPMQRLGKLTGVLVASVNLRRMWNVVDNIRFGKTGRAYIINDQGIFLAHGNEKYVLSEYSFPDKQSLHKAREGEVVNTRIKNFGGQDVFCSLSYIPRLNVFVVVEKKTSEAFFSLRIIMGVSIALLLLLTGAGMIFSFSTTRKIVEPIRALVNGFRNVSGGDLEKPVPVKGKDEIAYLTRGFNRMIGELKKKRDHISALGEKLKESERLSTIGAVASRVAHEIKNPLASLKLLTRSLNKPESTDEERRRILRLIPEEIDRLTRIVDDTLSVARRVPKKMERCRLQDIFEDLSLLVRDQLLRQNISLSFNAADGGYATIGSREHLFQVFLNLIQNAIDVLPEGGEIAITVEDIPRDSSLKIKVSDNGPGILESDLKKIFVPFVTFKEGGTGIGLAIVKQIIRDHGGKITVSSQPGSGTTFTIILPQYREEQGDEKNHGHRSESSGESPKLGDVKNEIQRF